jgi:hypothetical protein
MRVVLVGLIAVAGCVDSNDIDYEEDYDADSGQYVSYELHAASNFDHIMIWSVDSLAGGGLTLPRSPQILAGTVNAPEQFRVVLGRGIVDKDVPATSTYPYKYAHPWSVQTAIGVIASDAQGTVGAKFVILPRNATGTVELDATIDTEVWVGKPRINHPSEPCARFGGDVTTFIVRSGDRDCDGIDNGADCKPDDFCDPEATTPGGQAACTCP